MINNNYIMAQSIVVFFKIYGTAVAILAYEKGKSWDRPGGPTPIEVPMLVPHHLNHPLSGK